jgi:hypothetical protein
MRKPLSLLGFSASAAVLIINADSWCRLPRLIVCHFPHGNEGFVLSERSRHVLSEKKSDCIHPYTL